MELQLESVNAKIEASLRTLATQQSEEIAAEIRPILLANLAIGRMAIYIDNDASLINEYVNCVAKNYKQWHRYLYAVQVERDPLAWEALFKKLIHFAYRYFLHKNFNASLTTHESAEECAANAAIAILTARFPYDTHFDAWANQIVQNTCLKFMRMATRKKEIPVDMLVELDENEEDFLIDKRAETLPEKNDLSRTLADAVKNLNQARQQVIIMSYFYELPPAEIAAKMGKTVDAVYGLHFNAIKDLQKILRETGIILNGY